MNKKEEESDIDPGALFSSGLITCGALTGILIAALMGITASVDAAVISFVLAAIHFKFAMAKNRNGS